MPHRDSLERKNFSLEQMKASFGHAYNSVQLKKKKIKNALGEVVK